MKSTYLLAAPVVAALAFGPARAQEAPPSEPDADADDLEVFVRAPPVRREAAVTQVDAAAARKVPGTQGDVLKVVEAMPGVARATGGSGALIVWGAAPDETRIYLDDVPLPRLYHDGGARSVLGSELVSQVDLSPGAYGAAYGRGLGGLVRVTGQPLESGGDRLRGQASADVFDAGLAARGPLLQRVFLGGTARAGHLDRLVEAFVPAERRGLVPAPRSRDLHLRLTSLPAEGQRVELFWVFSGDVSRRAVEDPDPQRRLSERRGLDFQRLALRYAGSLAGGARLQITGFLGQDGERSDDAAGGARTFLARDADLAGLRVALTQRPSPGLSVETGLDLEASDAALRRQGAPTQPPREGDARVFGQPPPLQIAADTWRVRQLGAAPYVTADLAALDDRLHVEPGLRIDPAIRDVSCRAVPTGDAPAIGRRDRDVLVEPRLAMRLQLVPPLALVAAGGRYHQAAPDRDLGPGAGRPGLDPAAANHALFGLRSAPLPWLSLEATVFGRWSSHLPVRAETESPAPARALSDTGEERARGVQVQARVQRGERLTAWLSYAVSRSERRTANGGWRPADQDQTHVLTAVGSLSLPADLELGSRVRLSSGFPVTPVVGALYDAGRDRYEPLFGPVDDDRLPLFFQWDVRLAWRLHVLGGSPDSGLLEVAAEVQNVTDRQNVETWIYSRDYTRRRAQSGLPRLPYLGVRCVF